jgi:hypothetical protein
MNTDILTILKNAQVRDGLGEAWLMSDPGRTGAHEEGGFIVYEEPARFRVIRWQRGGRNEIEVPLHQDCCINGDAIVLSFHTHPNIGIGFLQEPSETDRRAIRDDPNLKGAGYLGELVISFQYIYLIDRDGQILVIGDTQELLF